jgi:threonine/homoserine/homoserine lactone efflux protein
MLEAVTALVFATTALIGGPGPAVVSLAAVGATSGIRNGLPYLLGILAGLFVALVGAVIGLATILLRWPQASTAIQLVGATYILYVAWKIGSAPVIPTADGQEIDHPTFRDGVILNLLNAKAYAAFFALFSQFLLPFNNTVLAYALSAAVVFVLGVIVDVAWFAAGGFLQSAFSEPRAARIIRIVFALLIVASVVWMLSRINF